MTEKDYYDFKNSSTCWFVKRYKKKVKWKWKGMLTMENIDDLHIKSNLNLCLCENIAAVFHKLQNYDSQCIFQEVGKHHFKINVISKTIEKHIISFTIKQPKKRDIKPGLLSVFIVSIF